jgi:hypothetical protein
MTTLKEDIEMLLSLIKEGKLSGSQVRVTIEPKDNMTGNFNLPPSYPSDGYEQRPFCEVCGKVTEELKLVDGEYLCSSCNKNKAKEENEE